MDEHGCRNCHQILGEGALKGPNLSRVTQRTIESSLQKWLRDPRAMQRHSAMPRFRLSKAEVEAILAYLKWANQEAPGG